MARKTKGLKNTIHQGIGSKINRINLVSKHTENSNVEVIIFTSKLKENLTKRKIQSYMNLKR